jgi:hypothetical protein
MHANTGTAAKLILLVLFSSTTLQATDGHIIPVGKQTLTPSHIWYRPCSGIWQSVFIESVPKNYVTELHIGGDATGQVNLTVYTSTKKSSVVDITVADRVSTSRPEIFVSTY